MTSPATPASCAFDPMVFSVIPIVGLAFSMFALARFPLSQEKMAEIRQQLEARRGKV